MVSFRSRMAARARWALICTSVLVDLKGDGWTNSYGQVHVVRVLVNDELSDAWLYWGAITVADRRYILYVVYM
jgi:hypothetical protein